MDRPALPALRSALDRAASRGGAAVGRRVQVDLRALAAFRIALGALIYVDLLTRARSLVAFYTDYGVLPRRALFSDYSSVYSLHAMVGEPWQVGLLFVVAGLFAVALLVGYRTRIATVVSWLLLMSLHARNPMVLNSGDVMLRALLFWGIFLPLGERWSLDARRTDRDRATVASIATLAALLQIVLMYAVNAAHKADSESWLSGEAVVYVFQADHFTYLLGDVVANYPPLLRAVGYLWLALVFAAPLLLLLTGIPRALLATLYAGMHFGMLLSMPIGPFPLIVMAGLLLFFPPVAWDYAAAAAGRFERLRAVRAWLARLDAPYPGAGATERLRNRVPDHEAVARARAAAHGLFFTGIPYLFLGLVLLSNAAGAGYAEVPDPADRALETVEMDQNWRMFAPNPVQSTRWYAAPATLADGREVDAFHGGAVSTDRPPDVEWSYPTFRWRKYLGNMRWADNTNHQSYYAHYLCQRWNRSHEVGMEEVRLYYGYEETDPYTGETTAAGGTYYKEYDCSGEFLQ